MLQVCLNGPRARPEHPALPIRPHEIAAAAREAVAAGAADIHLHPKKANGRDSLVPYYVATALQAVRMAVPGIPVGITTGAWTADDRLSLARAWTVLPDHASINFHEDGAEELAALLLSRGVAVHAGIFARTVAAERLHAWPLADRVSRILAEVIPASTVDDVPDLLASLSGLAAPVLLHGEDETAWPVLREAVARGLDVRIGLEDTLRLPDGTPAADNADLVRAAFGEFPS